MTDENGFEASAELRWVETGSPPQAFASCRGEHLKLQQKWIEYANVLVAEPFYDPRERVVRQPTGKFEWRDIPVAETTA